MLKKFNADNIPSSCIKPLEALFSQDLEIRDLPQEIERIEKIVTNSKRPKNSQHDQDDANNRPSNIQETSNQSNTGPRAMSGAAPYRPQSNQQNMLNLETNRSGESQSMDSFKPKPMDNKDFNTRTATDLAKQNQAVRQ